MPTDRPGTDAPDRDAGASAQDAGGGRPRGPKRPPRPDRSKASASPTPAPATGSRRSGGSRSKKAATPAKARPAKQSKVTRRSSAAVAGAGAAPAAVPPPQADDRQVPPLAPEGDGASAPFTAPQATAPETASTPAGATVADRATVTETRAPVEPIEEQTPGGTPADDTARTPIPSPAPVDQSEERWAPAAEDEPPARRAARKDTMPRRGRRVRRIVRRVELWSVLKLSLVLYTCLYAAVLATLALLWGLAYSSGQIERLQEFLADVGLENYRFYGDQMFRACAAIGAIGVLAASTVTVLTAALVNVISEMTGGIRVVVIEEDPAPRR